MFQEAFSQVSLTEAAKLLPWCISVAVPFCYISGTITTAAQQDEGFPTTPEPCSTASELAPEPHCSWALGPPGGLTPPPRTSLLPVSSLPDIPLTGTSMMGCLFSYFLAIPSQGKQDHSPSGSFDHSPTKRTSVCSQDIEVGVESSSSLGDQGTLELVPEAGYRPSSEQEEHEPVSPPSPSGATMGLVGVTMAGSLKSTKDPASCSSELSQGNVDNSDMDKTSGDCLSCSDTDDVLVLTAHKKCRKRM